MAAAWQHGGDEDACGGQPTQAHCQLQLVDVEPFLLLGVLFCLAGSADLCSRPGKLSPLSSQVVSQQRSARPGSGGVGAGAEGKVARDSPIGKVQIAETSNQCALAKTDWSVVGGRCPFGGRARSQAQVQGQGDAHNHALSRHSEPCRELVIGTSSPCRTCFILEERQTHTFVTGAQLPLFSAVQLRFTLMARETAAWGRDEAGGGPTWRMPVCPAR
ncbi:hypothetical protein QBC39DRAFT_126483 [Podospora conica]|nr:hypothetical protein QBC39DRAFT_126483 [Schizothecium conicum]